MLLALAGVIGYLQLTKKSKPPKKELSAVLNIYNWEDYFGTTTIEDFEKEFGVKVNLKTFEDEESMLSVVQSNPSEYDIVIASDILVREMIDTKLLAHRALQLIL